MSENESIVEPGELFPPEIQEVEKHKSSPAPQVNQQPIFSTPLIKQKGLSQEDFRLVEKFAEQSSLEIALSGKSPFFRSQVLTLMTRLRIPPSDPTFLMIIAMSEMENSIASYPITLQQNLTVFLDELEKIAQNFLPPDQMEAKTSAYLQQYHTAVAQTAKEMISLARQDEFVANVLGISRSLWLAIALLLGTFVGGIFATKAYYKLFNRSLISAGQITVEQYNDLKWLDSPEGQVAKNIAQWNASDLADTKSCQSTVQKLGIKANKDGKQVTTGFCVLFVEPPSKRN